MTEQEKIAIRKLEEAKEELIKDGVQMDSGRFEEAVDKAIGVIAFRMYRRMEGE